MLKYPEDLNVASNPEWSGSQITFWGWFVVQGASMLLKQIEE